MGHLKLSVSDPVRPASVSRPGADPINLKARRTSRPKPQHKPHLSGADQIALARIAERFAAGTQPDQADPAPEDQRFEQPMTQPPMAVASPSGMRTLIAVLIAIALLPSVTVGAMLWLGAIKTPGSTAASAESNQWGAGKSAFAATMPIADQPQSKQTAAIGALALTAPDALEAEAGGEVPFAIALDHTGDLPARSVIAVAGLPEGATLSSGRPYGEAEWNLKSDEIGDVRIILPKTASGESKLRVKLVAPDGEILAGAETLLKVSAAPETSAPGPAEPHAVATQPVYDPNLVGVAVFDDKSQELLGASGVEERFTAPEAPPAPPADVAPADLADEDSKAWVAPEFVNLRKGPTSSAAVISVVAKGTKLSVMQRKRGWVQVTDPATSQSGWIYAGSKRRIKGQSDVEAESSTSLWSGLGSLLGSQ